MLIPALLGVGILAAAAGPLWPVEIHSLGKVIRKEALHLAQPKVPVNEFVPGRKTLRGDVNGDGREDLVVLFTLERGDLWVQFLTVLSSAGSPLATTEVSRKGVRAVDLDRTLGPVIQLATKAYGPDDMTCCPSLPGRTSYVLRGRGLSEMKSSTATAVASRATPRTAGRARTRHH